MRSRRITLLLAITLLAGSIVAAQLPSASAQQGSGCPCVVLIEVDGLEPKDITQQTTPFLWEMSHPQGGVLWGGSSRAGWTWQAPRAGMASSTAASAASLLTGGYTEQTGIPGDEFRADDGTVRMQAQAQPDVKNLDDGDFFAESLLDLVPNGSEDKKLAAAFVGNPAMGGLIGAGAGQNPLRWAPTNDDAQNPPSPAYCDVPREAPSSPDQEFQPACSATDLVTLNKAITALNTGADAGKVALAYIHLAELGIIKRSEGDAAGPGENPDSESGQSVPQALAHLDSALATFVTRYQDASRSPTTAQKFNDTYFMLVGNHGYEPTPQGNRVPSGDSGSTDLESYIEGDGTRIQFVPQGGIGMVYATETDLARRRDALQSVRARLRNGGEVENVCVSRGANPAEGPDERGGCIKEILYTRKNLLPNGTTESEAKKLLLPIAHPSWHFDHVKIEDDGSVGGPTGISGDMVIVTERNWATGRAVADPDPNSSEGLPISETVNPYTGSSGGPRTRAVAAIINGPAGGNGARQVSGPYYPVAKESDDPETVPLDETPEPAYATIDAANDSPGDDANAKGHERQPETVDFAPTIAALLQISVPDTQLAGRFLQEAFLRRLSFPNLDEELEEPEPDPPPPPDPEPVIIIEEAPPPITVEQPPPPKCWDYRGLLRGFRVAVGDRTGRTFSQSGRRERLQYLILSGEFGKRHSVVKLTFYGESKKRTSGDRKRIRAMATFPPFHLERGRARLTLKVPTLFKPTYIGVLIYEGKKLSKAKIRKLRERAKRKGEDPKAVLIYRPVGRPAGTIRPVRWAERLHTRAPDRRRKPKTRLTGC